MAKRFIDVEQYVSATYYDDENEEWSQKTVTIKDLLCSVCDDYEEADVRENVRGEWIKGGEQPYFRKHFDIVVCSICNKRGEHRWNFCPNCGADMRGDKDEKCMDV